MADASTVIQADLATRVRQLVAAERGMVLEDIAIDSRLLEDLGMEGDDAVKFFRRFAREFGVDLAGMRWRRHFSAEGFFSWWIPDIPVTVRDLVNAASAKRWLMDYSSKDQ
jgi:hypothetical protein